MEWFVNDFKHKIIDVSLARNTLCNENFLQCLENYYKFIVFNYPYYRINYKKFQDNTDPTYYCDFVERIFENRPRYWTVFVEVVLKIRRTDNLVNNIKHKFQRLIRPYVKLMRGREMRGSVTPTASKFEIVPP